MIEKMIETFKENFNEEIYGAGFAVITPLIIRIIFEHSDIFKLLNVNYRRELEYKSTSVLIGCGSFGFNNDRGFNKHNFHTERYMGLTSEIEYSNIVARVIVSKFEYYLLKKISENIEETFIANFKDDLLDVSCEMYEEQYDNNIVITPEKLLNENDLKLLNTKHSIGNIVYLRENIYVYKDTNDKNDKFNNMYMSFKNKLCDYTPVNDVLIYRILKDESKYEIYFNASFKNFNNNIEITEDDTE